MAYRQTITDRVKFIIRYLISKGIAKSQADLGRKINIESTSYLSQLVNSKQNNKDFINKLMEFAPEINKDWLYDEAIESPFIDGEVKIETEEDSDPGMLIQELRLNIEMLKKDVRYYSDIADSRLQTINIQNKLIDNLEKLLKNK